MFVCYVYVFTNISLQPWRTQLKALFSIRTHMNGAGMFLTISDYTRTLSHIYLGEGPVNKSLDLLKTT